MRIYQALITHWRLLGIQFLLLGNTRDKDSNVTDAFEKGDASRNFDFLEQETTDHQSKQERTEKSEETRFKYRKRENEF